ncbi:membrane lipoprotein lipid attachment site-containing protein [Enterovibrio sp. ZSDZ42]|uniref:Membrane lipoprotein lipid attachment site-containing protein n=1 Tax=Enterovibrio gelatinilyticus TaxID=2899819 RepID=A0ABT5QWD9_9GAMM|nr:membrane lipoprotein lipid attachment site-containing protein [Enterovibrio sp. ZSDZ42]MDD1792335.1 membrane lipoprotein lipid attachment site-containing protein [Enterovibrio sp. ZSDZ42]
MKKLICAIGLSLALAGCSTPFDESAKFNAFEPKNHVTTIDSVVSYHGEPDEIIKNGDTTVYVYEYRETVDIVPFFFSTMAFKSRAFTFDNETKTLIKITD